MRREGSTERHLNKEWSWSEEEEESREKGTTTTATRTTSRRKGARTTTWRRNAIWTRSGVGLKKKDREREWESMKPTTTKTINKQTNKHSRNSRNQPKEARKRERKQTNNGLGDQQTVLCLLCGAKPSWNCECFLRTNNQMSHSGWIIIMIIRRATRKERKENRKARNCTNKKSQSSSCNFMKAGSSSSSSFLFCWYWFSLSFAEFLFISFSSSSYCSLSAFPFSLSSDLFLADRRLQECSFPFHPIGRCASHTPDHESQSAKQTDNKRRIKQKHQEEKEAGATETRRRQSTSLFNGSPQSIMDHHHPCFPSQPNMHTPDEVVIGRRKTLICRQRKKHAGMWKEDRYMTDKQNPPPPLSIHPSFLPSILSFHTPDEVVMGRKANENDPDLSADEETCANVKRRWQRSKMEEGMFRRRVSPNTGVLLW